MRARSFFSGALAALTLLPGCGGDGPPASSPTGDDSSGGGATTGTPASSGSVGSGGSGGSVVPEPVPCDAEGCQSFDCACGDGSIFRGFRSCKAQTKEDACPGACAAYGGWVQSGAAPPPDVGPLVNSVGLRAGQSCGTAAACSLVGWDALCADGQHTGDSSCKDGTCVDYPALGTAACATIGSSFVGHDDDATGPALVRTCSSVDWLRFIGSKNVLDDTSLGDAYAEASGTVRVAGTFHGYMDLGAGDESCFDGGLFLATYDEGALKARRAFCFFGNTSFDHPRLTKDGLYATSMGKVDWSGDVLEGGGSPSDWTLVHAGLDGSPGWTRHVTKTSGASVHLVAADDLGVVLFTWGDVTLWDATALAGHQLVRVSPNGDLVSKHAIVGMTGSYSDVYIAGGSAGHLLMSIFGGYDGDVVFNGTTLVPGGVSSTRIVALINPDSTVAWSQPALSSVDFHVGADGTSTLLVGSAPDPQLERRDPSGAVVWSTALPVPTTPHVYYVYGWKSLHVAASGVIHMTLMLGPDESITFAGVTPPSDTYPGGVGATYLTSFDANGGPSTINRFTRCSLGGRFVPDATGMLFVGTTAYCLESAPAADPIWNISATSYDTRNGLLMHLRE